MHLRRLSACLALAASLAGHQALVANPPDLEEVASSVRSLEARLTRIERALGISDATPVSADDPLPQAVQGLRNEVASLRTKVETAPRPAVPPSPAPAAPAVTGRWATTLYGYVKLDAIYDTHKTSIGDIAFFVLPEVAGRKDNEFNMTARESRLGVKIQAPAAGGVTASGVLEMDLYGGGSANSALPRLRLAYADVGYRDWTIRAGQDWETFITVIPKSLDFGYLADQGALGLRRAQLRATRRAVAQDKSAWETRLALVRTIGQDLDGGGQDDGVDAGVPTLQWNFFHERPSGFKVGFSGHWGREDVEHASGGLHDRFHTWSAIGSFVVPFSPKVSLQGTLWTGANLDTYFGGVGQGVNRAFGRSIAASGGFVQLVLNPTPKINLNFTAGLDDPDNSDLLPGMRSANRHFSSSLFYSWTPAVKTAVQLTDLTTSYFQQPDARTLRVHTALLFGF